MRKLFILLGILVTSLTLVGCNGEKDTVIAPTYTGILVEGVAPETSGSLNTYLQAKQDTVLVEIGFNNPDKVAIKSVVVDGYIYLSTRFSSNSTTQVVYLEINVGDTVGETIYSVNRFSYLDGQNTVNVDIADDNEFRVYVFKDVPQVQRENYNVEKELVEIDFVVTDVDDVIIPNTLIAYIYDGDLLVESITLLNDTPSVVFSELDADTQYDVRIEAAFNLDDGGGLLQNVVLYAGEYTTNANGVPSASIENVYVSSNEVTYDVKITDSDGVIEPAGLRVYIYDEAGNIFDQVNISGSLTGLSFVGLLNDNAYTIRVKADYDLDDGAGVITNNLVAEHNLQTAPRAVPLPQLLNLNLQENSIEFDVYVPTDGIIDKSTIVAELYIEGVHINTAIIHNDKVDFQVNNLFADHEFEIVLFANYNLNDGTGVHVRQEIYRELFSTLENDVPTVEIDDIIISQGYVTLNLEVSDSDATLTGALSAVLYEDDEDPLTNDVVATVQFGIDTLQLVFDYATKADVSYYIEIYASYNLRDGEGKVNDEILRRSISYTAEKKAPVAEIHDVVADTSTVEFDIRVIDADLTIAANTIVAYLYHDGLIVGQEIIYPGDNSVSFSGLLSANTYQIVIKADFNLEDGSGLLEDQLLMVHEFVTVAKDAPSYLGLDTSSDKDSISFSIEIVDSYNVITEDLFGDKEIIAKLFLKGVLIESVALETGDNFDIDFTTLLLSNNKYDIIIYASYNLNDGSDKIIDAIITEVEVSTDIRDLPSATVDDISITEEEISFDVNLTDVDDVILTDTTYAVLVQSDVPVPGITPILLHPGYNDDVTFSNLFSDETYVIRIVTDYNMKDAQPDHLNQKINSGTINVKTEAYNHVEAYITNEVVTATTIEFDVEIIDSSGVIDGLIQAILDMPVDPDKVVTLSVGTNHVVFNTLGAETSYDIDIVSFYDLNENGIEYDPGLLAEINLTTQPLGAPTASIISVVEGYDTITVEVSLNNDDGTIISGRIAQIWEEGVHLDTKDFVLTDGINEDVLFSGLDTNKTYEVRIVADYNLQDGSADQLEVTLDSENITTLEKFVPNVIVSNIVLTYDGVTFDIDIDDFDNVLTATPVVVSLYNIDGLVAERILITNKIAFDLSQFDANESFEIRISGEVNFEDGELPATVIIDTLEYTTLSYEVPTSVVDAIVVNQETLDFTINITDDDGVIIDNLVAILYDENNDPVIPSIALSIGVNEGAFDITLLYEEMYKLVVYADYNMLDGNGTLLGEVLSEQIISVNNKITPQAEISDVILGDESIQFDVDVFDNHTTILDLNTLIVELYLDGVKVDDDDLVLGNQTVIFNVGILSNREYEIRVVTDFDYYRFNGIYQNYIMVKQFETTVAKEEQEASIVIDTISATEIIVDIIIEDPSGLIGSRVVNFYEAGNPVPLDIDLTLIIGNNINITYSSLLGSTDYIIEVILTYDLNDGANDVTKTITLEQSTLGSSVPQGTIIVDSLTTSTASVTYSFADPDGVSTEQYIRIYKASNDYMAGEFLIGEGEDLTYIFTGLEPNEEYYVTVESTYNLNDLNGVQTDIAIALEEGNNTQGIVTIENEVIDNVSNRLDIVFDDYENIVNGIITATLYQDATPFATYIFTADAVTNLDMINLLSDFDYRLEITATYTTEGGTVADVVYIHEFTTVAMIRPTVLIDDIDNWVLNGSDTDVLITIGDDTDLIATNESWIAVIYRNGIEMTAAEVDIYVANSNANPENAGPILVKFVNIDFTDGAVYTIEVHADCNLNEVVAAVAEDVTLGSRTFIDAGN